MDTKTTAVIAEPKNEQKTLEFAADSEKATSEPTPSLVTPGPNQRSAWEQNSEGECKWPGYPNVERKW
jgi:hypothetical protein